MCLEIKLNQEILIAEDDIVCYKAVEENDDDMSYRTYFKNMLVKLGNTYYSEINTMKNIIIIEKALHSFTSHGLAEKFLIRRGRCNTVIVKCIIPKGAKYYEGRFEINNDSYASDTLTYTKEIFYV